MCSETSTLLNRIQTHNVKLVFVLLTPIMKYIWIDGGYKHVIYYIKNKPTLKHVKLN